MATTTNFGWATPNDTDFVKDGAAAIRTLGSSIDTSFVDLKGGTTGQILAKASNTDLDYSWVTNEVGDITAVTAGTGLTGGGTTGDVTLAIDSTVATLTGTQTLTNKTLTSPVLTTPSISNIDAKGDLLAGTADNTIGRRSIGTDGQILTADSAEATGMKWATPSAALTFGNSTVNTSQSTTSTSFTDLATSQATTVTTGTKALVILTCKMNTTATPSKVVMGFAVSGATTIAAGSVTALELLQPIASEFYTLGSSFYISSLTAGSNTFTAKFRVDSGTGTWKDRQITVIDLGS